MSENQEAQEVPAKKDFVPSEGSTANKKTRVGIVKSTGMEKTIVVEYTNRVPHPKFKKIIKQSKKFYAHDEAGEAAVGDKVRIEETTPISKLKRWKLVKVLSH
ncbi:30S ribosomal protein S17 [Akkermansiaceae bacterium]|jgi:small subunit ribosomal protein S17|nr:30S ribosomal protein S17 [Akkermansiaceae bacterium]MDA7522450.1 30S ribosomal protein S17 [Akkermansiaceae bacterium]MDA7623838.1 30S ribosomal protein S17 [Akkermansiaceae bacterium]MDA7630785.1 30S ribosomal protein S17 [Akkermansiaceae bacterium]MDA7673606.1 30S ribosomal protein S17 [Akkermansiaceae bacterium]|tara:strand:- start:17043 stop:17351 length:309 start_codon:yes stop_codon:yes gene_type:complete